LIGNRITIILPISKFAGSGSICIPLKRQIEGYL
jgi:hypothetical protein